MSTPVKARWVVAGGETLLGKEVADLCAERQLPVTVVLAGEGPGGVRPLVEAGGEAALLEELTADTLESASALFLAGATEPSLGACALAAPLGVPVVDLTGALRDDPRALVRAPALETGIVDGAAVHVVAHPAGIALARILQLACETSKPRNVVAHVFEPASVRGRAGVDELHQQTINLFNFRQLPREVFDAQVAFNLLPRFGGQASQSMEQSRRRAERDLLALLQPLRLPRPSLRFLHAPVFHGYCFSLWLDYESRPAIEALEEALRQGGVDVRTADLEPASNAGVAGQSGLTVSDIAEDPASPHSLWLWAACDNVRTVAENGVLVAAMFLGGMARA
jgi:aspartate-semialdehyde dehydrogenase